MKTQHDTVSDADRSVIIDKALPVIRLLTWCAGLAGTGCFICGIITVVFSSPKLYWPFNVGSGIWAGMVAMVQGICGYVLLQNINKSFPQASKSWMIAFYTFGIIGLSVSPQHLSYSIIGLTKCVTRYEDDTDDEGGHEQCNADHHDGLVALQVLGIVFSIVMEAVAITTLVYLLRKRRLAHLTGEQYNGNRCYRDCWGKSVSYNDI